jgi:signal transduction histidine kinase
MNGRTPRWKMFAPVAFVVTTLVALLVVPALFQRHVDELRNEIDTLVEPARALTREIQLALAFEVSALRGFLLTREDSFLERHRHAVDLEDRASTRLQSLAKRLDLGEQMLKLHSAKLGWRTPTAELLNRRIAARDYLHEMPRHHTLYERALTELVRLEEGISAWEARQQKRMQAAERLARIVNVFLVLVALAAALAVAWLTGRLRQLAHEAGLRRNEAIAAARARDEVLGIVSHDLRSPLTTISLSAGLLLEQTPEDDPRQQPLQTLQRSIRQMDRLIQDLLDVARIEASQLAVEPQAHAVEPLVHEAGELLRPLAAERELQFELSVEPGLEPVLADKERVLQVLTNLVGNAIKFTPAGRSIRLEATAAERAVRLSVVDQGPGIPHEQLDRLFDAYWQSRRTGREGAGLGLFISRGIVEAHGGRIWAESRPGEGSAFRFTLPVAEPVEVDTRAEPEPAAV